MRRKIRVQDGETSTRLLERSSSSRELDSRDEVRHMVKNKCKYGDEADKGRLTTTRGVNG